MTCAAMDNAEELKMKSDYLVIGAGGKALAFTDQLLAGTNTSMRTVIIVDDRCSPGGHWNGMYSFARHYKGLALRSLGDKPQPCKEKSKERISKTEYLKKCSEVMDRFVQGGRVKYLPSYTVDAQAEFPTGTNMKLTPVPGSDKTTIISVAVKRKIVDTTYMRVPDPLRAAGRCGGMDVDSRVTLVGPSQISTVPKHSEYVVMGAGRTGVDVVLWLLAHGVAPAAVHWVMPRDAWFFVAENIQGSKFMDAIQGFNKAVLSANTAQELLGALEADGFLCRIDPTQSPEVFHGNHVSMKDLADLRRVTSVVRKGYVRSITPEGMVLTGGSVPVGNDALYIDCTRSWVQSQRAPSPVYTARRINLQMVGEVTVGAGEFNEYFGAALIGHLEACYPGNTEKKNALCTPSPFPDTTSDWLRCHLLSLKNHGLWTDQRLASWLLQFRASRYAGIEVEALEALKASDNNIQAKVEKLNMILGEEQAGHASQEQVVRPPARQEQAPVDTSAQAAQWDLPQQNGELPNDLGTLRSMLDAAIAANKALRSQVDAVEADHKELSKRLTRANEKLHDTEDQLRRTLKEEDQQQIDFLLRLLADAELEDDLEFMSMSS